MSIFVNNILNLIGNTPLVEINSPNKKVKIFIKLEKFNPSGSIKDRIIKEIIAQSEKKGFLTKDKIILESSSGNTGIALAMIGGMKGYKVTIIMPKSMTNERKKLIKSYGAKLVLINGTSDDAKREAKKLAKNPKYFYINQYANGHNISAHYKTTGPEIWKQTNGNITHLIAGIGTGGTIMGIGKYLKEKNNNIKLIAIQPDKKTKIDGLKNMKISDQPDIFNPENVDNIINIKREKALLIQRNMAKKGILVGMSSGAAIYTAFKKAKEIKKGTIVVLSADGGEKYLSII